MSVFVTEESELLARLLRIEAAVMFIAEHGVPAGEGWGDRVLAILNGEEVPDGDA